MILAFFRDWFYAVTNAGMAKLFKFKILLLILTSERENHLVLIDGLDEVVNKITAEDCMRNIQNRNSDLKKER